MKIILTDSSRRTVSELFKMLDGNEVLLQERIIH